MKSQRIFVTLVIPAQAGIFVQRQEDSSLRWNDTSRGVV